MLKVICLGDSITGPSNLARYLKFSHILELMLQARLGFENVQVLNRGIGGDNTAGMLSRLSEDVLKESPQIVILMAGANDAMQQVPQSNTQANLESILSQLKADGIKTLMMKYHLLVNKSNPGEAWVGADNNNELIGEVADNMSIPLLDLSIPMNKAWEQYPVGELVSELDRLHINPRGELIFASNIFNKLDGLGWLK
jgi:lysophospholipase L1-like esterase